MPGVFLHYVDGGGKPPPPSLLVRTHAMKGGARFFHYHSSQKHASSGSIWLAWQPFSFEIKHIEQHLAM
jgi:hypothetical protein